ncbi:hypothetical protein CAL7716_097660 [Calothrix sp. PCC 7716]|nr:hypothetical protein CAL7716_097660 [Calothrix sp. PCC 7716]
MAPARATEIEETETEIEEKEIENTEEAKETTENILGILTTIIITKRNCIALVRRVCSF